MAKWFLLLFLCVYGHAAIELHLKSLEHRECVSISGIDFIYLINLDKRPEKLALSFKALAPYGIAPCRFSAVNGWELSEAAIMELGVVYESWMMSGLWGTTYLEKQPVHELVSIPGKTYFSHCLALGAIGCVLSHLSVLQDAWDSGYETIWVLEDDVEIIQDPHLLSDRIEELDLAVGKEGWDVLFTDQDTKNREGNYVPCCTYAWRPNFSPANVHRFALRKEVSPNVRQVGARYGSYSMILRRSGIKKILSFLKSHQVFLPYDMEYTQPNSIRLFTVRDDIVSTQPTAPSDNGIPGYEQN